MNTLGPGTAVLLSKLFPALECYHSCCSPPTMFLSDNRPPNPRKRQTAVNWASSKYFMFIIRRSRSSSVGIVTGLQAGRPRFHTRQGQEFLSLRYRVQPGTGAHPASCPKRVPGALTTHLHLVPRLRMHGAIPPIPQHVFIGWC